MRFDQISAQAISAGKQAFYAQYSTLGAEPGPHAAERRSLPYGSGTVPGVILAALASGVTDGNQIVDTAARITHCRRGTVLRVLNAYTGMEVGRDLWAIGADGRFFDLNRAANALIRREGLAPAR